MELGLGRAADRSTALLQTRASAINAHGSSDHGFARRWHAVDYAWGLQRIVFLKATEALPVHRSIAAATA